MLTGARERSAETARERSVEGARERSVEGARERSVEGTCERSVEGARAPTVLVAADVRAVTTPSPPDARERTSEPHPQASSPRLVALVVPAPPLPIGLVMSLVTSRAPSLAWVPSASDDDPWSFVGWGIAARANGVGEDRLAQVRASAARLFDHIDRAGALPFPPRLFGGFAFDAAVPPEPRPASPEPRPASPLTAAWAPFGDAGFILPHTMYASSGDRALLVAFVPESEAIAAAATLDDLRRSLEAAPAPAPAPASTDSAYSAAPGGAPALRAGVHNAGQSVRTARRPPPAGPPAAADPVDPAAEIAARQVWLDLVTRAVAEIERGTFAKVVLSRTRHLPFESEPDLRRAFTFVEPRHPACARFLFTRETSTFLGATPERLLSVRGRRAVTEALAGSIPRRSSGDDLPARAELLASEKDRAEHSFVIDAIRAALAPSCDALSIPEAPMVRSLAHVHHLATPITATLRERVHLLDLAARLHPTPALCGSPREEARAFLLAHETDPRGWYGGAVGWFDERGDGTLAVAIRSALATPAEAWIYAGAGIVRGSDPAHEYTETTVKERAMCDALHAASGSASESATESAPESASRSASESAPESASIPTEVAS